MDVDGIEQSALHLNNNEYYSNLMAQSSSPITKANDPFTFNLTLVSCVSAEHQCPYRQVCTWINQNCTPI